MKWFQDRKTTTKLFLAFGLMSAIMLVVGWFGMSGMNRIDAMLGTLFERDMMGAIDIQFAQAHFLRIGREYREAILSEQPAAMNEHARLMEKADEEFRANLDAAEKKLATPEAKAMVAEIRAAYPPYIEALREMVKRAMANDKAAAIQNLPRTRELLGRVDAPLGKLVGTKIDVGKRTFAESSVVSASARNTMLVMMALAVLFGAVSAVVVGRALARPLGEAVSVLETVAQGDFTRTIHIETKDEVGDLARALDRAVGRVRSALDEVRSVAGGVASASQQLAAASTSIASGAQQQAASLEETAASLEEITVTVKQNADGAQHAAQLASTSRDVAEKGGRVVDAAVGAMTEITTSSKKIAEIITTIDEIAFQTNLLALNAAVEAARAGEQGRGFAVVAAEVRTLAQRSATAAKEIKGLIVDSVGKVEAGSKHVTESGETLHEIVGSVKRVTDMVSEIAAASREQNTAIEQVNTAVTQMDQVTQSNASQTEELSATAEQLTQQAVQLQQLVARFRLESADEARSFASRKAAFAPAAATAAKGAAAPSRPASRVTVAAKRAAGAPSAPRSNVAVLRSASRRPEPLPPTGTDGFDEF